MTLEKAIKQDKFGSVYQRMMINILYTSSWLQGMQQRSFREFGLTMQQYNILRILRGQKGQPIPLNCISDRMIDRMSNCSRLVEKLRQKGYVDRQASATDRRAVDVVITKKGLNLLDEIQPISDEVENSFNHLSEEDAMVLNDLLDKLRKD
jgi:DNA-binding MarR family transcriptional regulator